MSYYHVSVTYKTEQNKLEKTYEIDLNFYALSDWVKMYKEGQTFLCGGIAVIPFRIHRIEIFKTDTKILDDYVYDDYEGIWDYIHENAKVVTREFIKSPPKKTSEEMVPKRLHDKLLEESKVDKKVIETLSKYRGIPELEDLLEKAKAVGIDADQNWVLALCAVNLIEASVNKKLEELGETTDGSFDTKYKRLISAVKKKEHRDIQQLLPTAMYKGIRNKLDHASHANKVTKREAQEIKKIVTNILNDLLNTN